MRNRSDGVDGWMAVVEEDLSGQRTRATELAQAAERDRRELTATQDRLRETEALALQAISQISVVSGRLDEVQNMRERIGRFQTTIDEHAEKIDVTLRQLRHEFDVERETLAQSARRLDLAEQGISDLGERLAAIDEAIQRLTDSDGELAQRIAQTETHADANEARIAANAEGLRRAHTEQRAADAREEISDRKLGELTERLNVAQQSLHRVRETADQWEDIISAVEAMRARADDARRMLDEATATATSVRRNFETMEERIGDVERASEQLRIRDSHRERSLSALSEELERARNDSISEQQRFVALQEQIRRRQITDLEQEIRELKAYGRIKADD